MTTVQVLVASLLLVSEASAFHFQRAYGGRAVKVSSERLCDREDVVNAIEIIMGRASKPAASTAPLDALLFDCDGVIADTERDGHRVAFNKAFVEVIPG